MLTVKTIVKALRTVPEKKFRIVELAPHLLDDSGNVDIVKAMDKQGELNLSIVEVESYIKATRAFKDMLCNVGGQPVRSEDVIPLGDGEYEGDEE